MKETTKISDAEWLVCQVLWRDSPLTANEIISRLAENTGWNPSTVKTLLTRLVKKGVLNYRNIGREYHYFPTLGEEECVESHTRSFMERVFNRATRAACATGAVGAMAAAFLKNHHLTNEEIAELKAILEQKSADAQSDAARTRAANRSAKT